MEYEPFPAIPDFSGRVPSGFHGFLRIPATAYHADPCEQISLSSSIAKEIVNLSPLHGWLKHPRLGNLPREATKSMMRGSLLHELVLGQQPQVVRIYHDDYRKKAAQEARDSALAEGKIPFLDAEYTALEALAAEVQGALRAEGISLTGAIEVGAFWEEEVDGLKVSCRALMDHVIPEEGVIHDFKFFSSASPDFIGRAVIDFGYDIQHAAYTSALEKIADMGGRVDFSWIIVEELPEGSSRRAIVQVARPSGILREMGRIRWNNALVKWSRGINTNYWPAYSEGPVLVDPPAWAVKKTVSDAMDRTGD